MLPAARIIGLLVNPTNAVAAENQSRAVQAAAQSLGLQLHILHARVEADFETVFASLAQLRAGALVIGSDLFFTSQRQRLAVLSARHAIPSSYTDREFAVAGGLMSYGPSQTDAYRRAGIYAGRILKGEKPGDLPVEQPTKFEMVINLKTAKALGLPFPTRCNCSPTR